VLALAGAAVVFLELEYFFGPLGPESSSPTRKLAYPVFFIGQYPLISPSDPEKILAADGMLRFGVRAAEETRRGC
jgi:hypothetical protein